MERDFSFPIYIRAYRTTHGWSLDAIEEVEPLALQIASGVMPLRPNPEGPLRLAWYPYLVGHTVEEAIAAGWAQFVDDDRRDER